MSRLRLFAAGAVLLLSACGGSPTTFKVRIANIAPFTAIESGVYNTPVGAGAPGPILSGHAYEFTVHAGKGHHLSFASMFGASNDWFFGFAPEGLALYDDAGNPISGDVTSQVQLWNAGTEVDQEPGVGLDTGPKQEAPDQGAPDPDNHVRALSGTVTLSDGSTFTLPSIASMIQVTITPNPADRSFLVHIENVSTASTLLTSEGAKPVGISPGVYAVHGDPGVLFAEGQPDKGQGLELIAESGRVTSLQGALAPLTGVATPISPGVYAVHTGANPLFTAGMPDQGMGLEHLAEDGQTSDEQHALTADTGNQVSTGIFNLPEGATAAGPVKPGGAFEFTVTAMPGDKLSFATMFGVSDDWIFAGDGLPLFDATGKPISGDVTSEVAIWDLGTEKNELLAIGPDTGPNQSAPNTGPADPDNLVRLVPASEYDTPVSKHLQVTVTPQ